MELLINATPQKDREEKQMETTAQRDDITVQTVTLQLLLNRQTETYNKHAPVPMDVLSYSIHI